MRKRQSSIAVWVAMLAIALSAAAPSTRAAASGAPVSLASGRVSITGTSNIHPYTASTTDVRVVRVQLASGVAGGDWADVVRPGAIEAFEISIPAASLSSPKEGIDKVMHKALKVAEFPEIKFHLTRLEGAGGAVMFRGVGTLEIAGVVRDVALDLRTQEAGSTLTVKGELPLLMTDYGVTPPKAMLGMLKTDPKVTVAFEIVLALPANTPVATN